MPTYGRFSGRGTNPMTEAKKRGAALRKAEAFRLLQSDIGQYQFDLDKYKSKQDLANVGGNILSTILFAGMPASGFGLGGAGLDPFGKVISSQLPGLAQKTLRGGSKVGVGSIFGTMLSGLFGGKKPELPSMDKYTDLLTGPYMAGSEKSISDALVGVEEGGASIIGGIGKDKLLMSLLMSGLPEFKDELSTLKELMGFSS